MDAHCFNDGLNSMAEVGGPEILCQHAGSYFVARFTLLTGESYSPSPCLGNDSLFKINVSSKARGNPINK